MNGHLSECNGRPNLVGISWRVPTLSDNHCEPTLLGLYGLQYTFCWSLYSSIWFFCSIFLQKIKVAVLSKMLLCARSASEQFSRTTRPYKRRNTLHLILCKNTQIEKQALDAVKTHRWEQAVNVVRILLRSAVLAQSGEPLSDNLRLPHPRH